MNAGAAAVTVTGKGNYAGSAHAAFEIAPASIAKAKVSGLSSMQYTGKAIKPALKVKIGSKTLTSGVDYSVTYKNNVKVGTASVKVKGKGNYKGSVTKKFEIVRHAAKRSNTMTVQATTKTLKAKGLRRAKLSVRPITVSEARGNVTFAKTSGSKRLSIAKDTGKVTVKKGTPKGAYRITVAVRAAGTARYLAKTATVTVKVNVR